MLPTACRSIGSNTLVLSLDAGKVTRGSSLAPSHSCPLLVLSPYPHSASPGPRSLVYASRPLGRSVAYSSLFDFFVSSLFRGCLISR